MFVPADLPVCFIAPRCPPVNALPWGAPLEDQFLGPEASGQGIPSAGLTPGSDFQLTPRWRWRGRWWVLVVGGWREMITRGFSFQQEALLVAVGPWKVATGDFSPP